MPPLPCQGGRTVWRTPPGRPPRSRGRRAGGRPGPREGGLGAPPPVRLCSFFLSASSCARLLGICVISSGRVTLGPRKKPTWMSERKIKNRGLVAKQGAQDPHPRGGRRRGGGSEHTSPKWFLNPSPIGVRQGSGRNHGGGGGAVMAAVFVPYARGWGEREGENKMSNGKVLQGRQKKNI